MMVHDDASELLASMALDALDEQTHSEVEGHVLTCPECQGELNSLRHVASALGNTFEVPPEGLWSRISARLYETDPADAPSPPVFLSDFDPTSRSDRRGMRGMRSIILTASLTAAAAILFLVLSLASANGRVSNLGNALASNGHNGVASALATPGHQVVTVSNFNHTALASFVLLPDGRGYLIHSALPVLPSTETYQLWSIDNGSPVSIGVMGPSPRIVSFTAVGLTGPSKLAVTIEPAGGSLTPSKSLVASGEV